VTDYVPQIRTVVGTLAGSLGGVALTQRHQRQMVRMERVEKRRERSITQYDTRCHGGPNFAQRMLNALEPKVC
jgi:hypothetical protein